MAGTTTASGRATCAWERTGSVRLEARRLAWAAVAVMEREEDSLSARPALETEGLRFLHVTGESLRGSRGAPPP